MGWYRSVARPLFLALPPETAHRVAHGLLGLPLPWERIGRPVTDPALEVSVAGLRFANPVGLAAGFDKTGERVDALGRLGFGFVVAGTFTARPRAGNARPRIVRYPDRRSMINAMGLPNPGAEWASMSLAASRQPSPAIASIADEDLAEVAVAHALLEPHAAGIELNASCPNVSWGRDRDNEAHLARILRDLADRRRKPLFVKLPPFRGAVEREVVLALARIAQEGGADGLTCSNTRPVREGRLSTGEGGLSGHALFVDTPRIVREIRDATGGELPISAVGGIATAAEAIDCLDAGATTVQIYTGLVYRGPGILRELTAGLAGAPRSNGAAERAGLPGD